MSKGEEKLLHITDEQKLEVGRAEKREDSKRKYSSTATVHQSLSCRNGWGTFIQVANTDPQVI